MDLKRPLLALLVAGSLVACGDDPDRGGTACDAADHEASAEHDAECEEDD